MPANMANPWGFPPGYDMYSGYGYNSGYGGYGGAYAGMGYYPGYGGTGYGTYGSGGFGGAYGGGGKVSVNEPFLHLNSVWVYLIFRVP